MLLFSPIGRTGEFVVFQPPLPLLFVVARPKRRRRFAFPQHSASAPQAACWTFRAQGPLAGHRAQGTGIWAKPAAWRRTSECTVITGAPGTKNPFQREAIRKSLSKTQTTSYAHCFMGYMTCYPWQEKSQNTAEGFTV